MHLITSLILKIFVTLVKILYFATINFATTCDYMSFVAILATINYF